MLNLIQIAVYIVLLFMLYFGFNLSGINTRYISTALLFVIVMLLPGARKRFSVFFKHRYNTKITKTFITYTLVVLAMTALHMQMDLNMARTAIVLYVFYVDCLLLASLLPKEWSRKSEKMLIGIFIIQSLIIIAAFLNPSVLLLVRQFQFENMMEITAHYLDYGTYRGLALAGEQFHGLTVAYGLVFIVTMKKYIETKNYIWLAVIFLLFVANMFVGRTGFIGFAIAMLYLVWDGGKRTFSLLLKLGISFILIVAIAYTFLPSDIKQVLDDSVFAYAFQMFYNYRDSGHMETSSTDRVKEMWQESFSFVTFLIGDGKFLNADGTYYRQVDVGYLRQLFYGGFFFMLYTIIITFRVLVGYCKNIKIKNYKFEVSIFLFLLIVHAKGLDFMYASEPMLIVFIYYIHQYIMPKYEQA